MPIGKGGVHFLEGRIGHLRAPGNSRYLEQLLQSHQAAHWSSEGWEITVVKVSQTQCCVEPQRLGNCGRPDLPALWLGDCESCLPQPSRLLHPAATRTQSLTACGCEIPAVCLLARSWKFQGMNVISQPQGCVKPWGLGDHSYCTLPALRVSCSPKVGRPQQLQSPRLQSFDERPGATEEIMLGTCYYCPPSLPPLPARTPGVPW